MLEFSPANSGKYTFTWKGILRRRNAKNLNKIKRLHDQEDHIDAYRDVVNWWRYGSRFEIDICHIDNAIYCEFITYTKIRIRNKKTKIRMAMAYFIILQRIRIYIKAFWKFQFGKCKAKGRYTHKTFWSTSHVSNLVIFIINWHIAQK